MVSRLILELCHYIPRPEYGTFYPDIIHNHFVETLGSVPCRCTSPVEHVYILILRWLPLGTWGVEASTWHRLCPLVRYAVSVVLVVNRPTEFTITTPFGDRHFSRKPSERKLHPLRAKNLKVPCSVGLSC
jgi:hypothetical protein